MPMPVVPPQNPGQGNIILSAVANPYQSVWWTSQSVTGVPESIMGWLVAQGFDVTGVSAIPGTNPPTYTYALAKQGLQPWQVLLSLCNSYTIAANDARASNQVRYNEIVTGWTAMVTSSQTHFDAQTSEQNAQAAVYLGDLNTYMTDIEALIAENRSQIVADAQTANTALGEMNSRLVDLEANAQASAGTIGSLLIDQAGYLNSFLTDFSAKLAELDQNYTNHLATILSDVNGLGVVQESHITAYNALFAELATDYTTHASTLTGLLSTSTTNTNSFVNTISTILDSLATDYDTVSVTLNGLNTTAGTLVSAHAADYAAVLALLVTDYTTHAGTATAFLTGLGSTELARINEQFVSNLSIQLQDLIDRGLSSSGVITDITARNHRDRDEQIQMLNDRLNREKWENQHRIYEQQVAMRSRVLDGKDRIHSVQQEILRYQAAQVTGIFSLLQEMRNRTLAGRQAILSAQEANTRLGIEVQSNLYSRLLDVRMRTIESADRVYQLRDVLAKWRTLENHQLFDELQKIQSQHLAGIERQHAAQQEISRIAMSQRDTLLAQLQDALKGILTGKERYSSVLMQHASTLAEHKHRAIVEKMNTTVQRLEGWSRISDQNRALMAYQLDERNKLLVGLYSFVERRDDVAPEWKDMASMIAGLGDSAGGWIQP